MRRLYDLVSSHLPYHDIGLAVAVQMRPSEPWRAEGEPEHFEYDTVLAGRGHCVR